MKVALFSLTALVSALVMFTLEPLLAKLLLPSLGGVPAVWNAALVFFQATLLAGYALAHVLSKLGARRYAIAHALLFAAGWLALPLHLDASLGAAWAPSLRVLAILTLGAGLPFLALATNAPTLGKHFSTLDHPAAKDPYFLYAASNVGSAVALIAYPLFIERDVSLSRQVSWLAYAYAALAVLIVGCAAMVVSERKAVAAPDAPAAPTAQKIEWPRRLRWLLLAALPSAQLVAVTQYLTTDITPAPLLWVVPLFAYLASFVLVFSQRFRPRQAVMARALPLFAAMAVLTLVTETNKPPVLVVVMHLGSFFLAAMVCHGELADDRPPVARLTEFYLWMSAGGVLGGLLVALVAPAVLDRDAEYPLTIVIALCLRPAPPVTDGSTARRRLGVDAAVAAGALVLTLAMVRVAVAVHATEHLLMAILGVPILAVYSTLNRPIRFALALGAILIGSVTFEPLGKTLLHTRSFFGALRVTRDPTARFIRLIHGSTVHGAQALDPASRRTPLSYYHPTGPIGDVFTRHKEVHPPDSRVGVVGLGTGTLATYARPGEQWTFYEINADVTRIATDTRYFTFLSDAFPGGANLRLDLGDARLRLAQTDERYSVLVVDAFTSDAIPVHLLTVEAMRTYVQRLQDDGLLAFHCSNKYLDLEPLLALLAKSAGLVAYDREDAVLTPEQVEAGKAVSEWIVMARATDTLGASLRTAPWRPANAGKLQAPWTDDLSSIVPLFR